MHEHSIKRRIVVVSHDTDTTASVTDQLRQRYGVDYEVSGVTQQVPDASVSQDAALLLADVMWDNVEELLSRVRTDQPETRRVGIAPLGMPVASDKLQGLLRSGLIDWFAIRPQLLPDEQFHRTISEFLEEWSRENSVLFEVVRVVDTGSPKGHRLRDLFKRNNVPYGSYEPSSDHGREIMQAYGLGDADLPAIVLYDGRTLRNPSKREVADAITGQTGDPLTKCDVVVVGGGPSGLAAAVYAAAEGLSVVVLEREAIGGQAGTTSMIRNYLGFQRGITGQELAARAFRQAWGFGANVRFMREATALRPAENGYVVAVTDGTEIFARSVVLAQGVSYRRIDIPSLEALVGAGVFYGAAVTEAPLMRVRDVFIVGGGNSAGQAAVHLAKFARSVTVLVRTESLAESMSDYLISEMRNSPNISIEFSCQIVDGGGSRSLEWLEIENGGTRRRVGATALFVLIGATPATAWLPHAIVTDDWGFVLTGRDVEGSGQVSERLPFNFESTLPGVFAVGDLRHGSVKRVASAVGEGSVVIQAVQQYLNSKPSRIEERDTSSGQRSNPQRHADRPGPSGPEEEAVSRV